MEPFTCCIVAWIFISFNWIRAEDNVQCEQPPDPENGEVIVTDLMPGSKLRYKCSKGYNLFEFGTRICSLDGKWTGEEPKCTEHTCFYPKAPVNGKVHVGGKKIRANSIVVFSCNSGYTLMGAVTSKCMPFGGWSTSTPKCMGRCNFRDLPKGVGVRTNSNIAVKPDELGKDVCEEGYSQSYDPKCVDGNWRLSGNISLCQERGCEAHSFNDGEFYVHQKILSEREREIYDTFFRRRNHTYVKAAVGGKHKAGTILYVQCKSPHIFQGTDYGHLIGVRCRKGSWKPEPQCLLPRCHLKQLRKIDGVKNDSDVMVMPNEAAKDICIEGYLQQQEPVCINGSFSISENITLCEEKGCKVPALHEGEILYSRSRSVFRPYRFKWNTSAIYRKSEIGKEYNSGRTFYVKCNLPYAFLGVLHTHAPIRCSKGNWEPNPLCLLPTCSLKDLPQEAGLSTAPNITVGINAFAKNICVKGYRQQYEPKCFNGTWSISDGTPLCKETQCNRTALDFQGLAFSAKSVYQDGQSFVPICKDGYTAKRERLMCNDGKWQPIANPCTPANCSHPPPAVDHGVADRTIASHGTYANYSCDPGYVLERTLGQVSCAYGNWIGVPPICRHNAVCDLSDLAESIPEYIIPDIEGLNAVTVRLGDTVRLKCDQQNYHLIGVAKATCDLNKKWITGYIYCIRGCAPINKKGSQLTVTPQKDMYMYGDMVKFSCPPGLMLTTDTELTMCLSGGWSEYDNIPDCKSLE